MPIAANSPETKKNSGIRNQPSGSITSGSSCAGSGRS